MKKSACLIIILALGVLFVWLAYSQPPDRYRAPLARALNKVTSTKCQLPEIDLSSPSAPIKYPLRYRMSPEWKVPMGVEAQLAYYDGTTLRQAWAVADTGSTAWVAPSGTCQYRGSPCPGSDHQIDGAKLFTSCPTTDRYGDGTSYRADLARVTMDRNGSRYPIIAQLITQVNDLGPTSRVQSILGLAVDRPKMSFLSQMLGQDGPQTLSLDLRDPNRSQMVMGGQIDPSASTLPLMPLSFYDQVLLEPLQFYIVPLLSIEVQSRGRWYSISAPPVAILDTGTTLMSTTSTTRDRILRSHPSVQAVRFVFSASDGGKVGVESPIEPIYIQAQDSLKKQIGGNDYVLIGLAWLRGNYLGFDLRRRTVHLSGNTTSPMTTDVQNPPPTSMPQTQGGGGKCAIM